MNDTPYVGQFVRTTVDASEGIRAGRPIPAGTLCKVTTIVLGRQRPLSMLGERRAVTVTAVNGSGLTRAVYINRWSELPLQWIVPVGPLEQLALVSD